MRATDSLRLAQLAASTDADHSAYQLLSNEFQNMSQLTDKYLAQRANLTYLPPEALPNDDLNQKIVACGHVLGSMAGSVASSSTIFRASRTAAEIGGGRHGEVKCNFRMLF
ncbi:MAG: hypothetical protein WB630_20930 [Candidatus Acidiferrales bacterium]